MDPFNYVYSLLPARVGVPVLALIGLCALLDAALPQPKAGSIWVVPRRVVTLIGANWLYARNLIAAGAVAGVAARAVSTSAEPAAPSPDAGH